jgi:hypothetical protein
MDKKKAVCFPSVFQGFWPHGFTLHVSLSVTFFSAIPAFPRKKKHVNGDHGDKPWDSSVVSNKKPELAMATNIKQTIC